MRASRFILMFLAVMFTVFVFAGDGKAGPALRSGTVSNATESFSFVLDTSTNPPSIMWRGSSLPYVPLSHWYTGEGMDELAVVVDFWGPWLTNCTETITPPVGPPVVNQFTVTYDP